MFYLLVYYFFIFFQAFKISEETLIFLLLLITLYLVFYVLLTLIKRASLKYYTNTNLLLKKKIKHKLKILSYLYYNLQNQKFIICSLKIEYKSIFKNIFKTLNKVLNIFLNKIKIYLKNKLFSINLNYYLETNKNIAFKGLQLWKLNLVKKEFNSLNSDLNLDVKDFDIEVYKNSLSDLEALSINIDKQDLDLILDVFDLELIFQEDLLDNLK
jgi:hypothetical protein